MFPTNALSSSTISCNMSLFTPLRAWRAKFLNFVRVIECMPLNCQSNDMLISAQSRRCVNTIGAAKALICQSIHYSITKETNNIK